MAKVKLKQRKSRKKEPYTVPPILTGIGFMVAITIIVGCLIVPLIQNHLYAKQSLQEVCELLGHEKLTDYKNLQDGIFDQEDVVIECDGKVLGGVTCHTSWVCVKRDKFGDCLDENPKYNCWTRYDSQWIIPGWKEYE